MPMVNTIAGTTLILSEPKWPNRDSQCYRGDSLCQEAGEKEEVSLGSRIVKSKFDQYH